MIMRIIVGHFFFLLFPLFFFYRTYLVSLTCFLRNVRLLSFPFFLSYADSILTIPHSVRHLTTIASSIYGTQSHKIDYRFRKTFGQSMRFLRNKAVLLRQQIRWKHKTHNRLSKRERKTRRSILVNILYPVNHLYQQVQQKAKVSELIIICFDVCLYIFCATCNYLQISE